MTPTEEKELLDRLSRDLAREAKEGKDKVIELINGGTAPRDAIDQVNADYNGKFANLYAAALSEVLGREVTAANVLRGTIGEITLSKALYENAKKVSAQVRETIALHVKGFQDSRKLAKELYEGYGFKTDEPLKINSRNKLLPESIRKALATDPEVSGQLQRAFDEAGVKALRTKALRAAYLELLDSLGNIEGEAGAALLEKKLQVAYEEKMRYFANRIAQTELHRAYALEIAQDIADDEDIKFVQYDLAPTHPVTDICDYFAKANLYGLGAGVFPAGACPVPPIHPFCRCQLTPRVDLFDRAVPKKIQGAEKAFFSSLSIREQKLVAGTKANLAAVRNGKTMKSVWNSRQPDQYKVKTIGDVKDGATDTVGGGDEG